MARIIIILDLHGYADHAIYHVCTHFLFILPYTRRRKNISSELALNPDLLASQVAALTTRPWLLFWKFIII